MLSTKEAVNAALENELKTHASMGTVPCDAHLIAFLLENIELDFDATQRFYLGKELLHRADYVVSERRSFFNKKITAELESSPTYPNGISTKCYDGNYDFGHTAPDFEAILSLGIHGLKKRAEEYSQRHENSPESREFFSALKEVYTAVESFLLRLSKKAEEKGLYEISKCVSALSRRAPETLFEAMQLMFVMYVLIFGVEGTVVRTFGRLDTLFEPFFEHDISNGIHTESTAQELVSFFIKALDSYSAIANLPFAIAGNKDGKSSVCRMSYILLETYIALKPQNVKIHFLYDKNIPKELVRLAFEGIRSGANSIVFMCDRTVQRSLLHIGAEPCDTEAYSVVGCYECGARDEVTCSCAGRVNIPKALEATLFGGKELSRGLIVGIDTGEKEYASYGELLEDFYAQLEYFADASMKITDCYEQYYPLIHSSPIFSSTYLSCLENGGDIYCNSAAKYTNTSINALGLADTADSLAAIKKLVYDDKIITLGELRNILKNDWQGHEELRLLVKNRYPKYGMSDGETDRSAADIVRVLDRAITGKPNKKGGVYRFGTFSIDWRIDFGKHTAASANGKKHGEMLSLNTGAAVGADRNGVTAHILSVCGCGGALTPNGSVLDLDLHTTAVAGEKGLAAMTATLETYEENGGFAVHYNVLDSAVLRDAQKHPENYPNLQVRLCGWNALFTSLGKQSQDDFIERAEKRESR
jgi:formate C-acetyltransferase